MRIALAAPLARGLVPVLIASAAPVAANAQTDYFNTDRGRPLHVQDATAIERYAFELQVAPLRWSRARGSNALWSVEPELAYGILPRTQVELGVPLFFSGENGGQAENGIGAVHLSVMHALNIETLGWPALAIKAAISIPAGEFGPEQFHGTIGGIATRTMGWGRIHLNGDVTPGDAPDADDLVAHDLSRWTAGVAVDRAIPLRSLLLGAEVVAEQPMHRDEDIEWRAAAGVRWQLTPYWALDAGIGRSFGDEREWSLTFGAARAFGLFKFFPVSR